MAVVNRRYLRQKRGGSFHRSSGFLKKTSLFLAMTVLLLAAAYFCLGSTIRQSIEYQGKILASELLAEETLAVLDQMELSYGDLVTVSKDTQGRIVSIETNSAKVNQLKNLLERSVAKALESQGSHAYSLPLGTLLGSDWLSGRGPEVPLRITPMGYLESTVESRFRAAGINQTNHQLVLELTLDLSTLVPLHQSRITVSTNVVLAETVIVGEVPEYYTSLAGEASDAPRMDPWDAAQLTGE